MSEAPLYVPEVVLRGWAISYDRGSHGHHMAPPSNSQEREIERARERAREGESERG